MIDVNMIENCLRDNDVFADVWDAGNGDIKVEINWGDWKHDHLRCRHIMRELGFERINEVVTADDGSDCYSALHTYRSYR